jgi:uncharacterized protein
MTPASFHALAKPARAICHLDSAYCSFLSKEALYPDSPVRMTHHTLETHIRQAVESKQAPHVAIAWQGAEPTLVGLDFFRRATALVRKYTKPGMTVEHTIQTNGLLLDEEWCAFFRDHRFLVGLPLDGPRRMQDAYRVDRGGQPTFDRVIEAAHLMRREGVEHNILCAVHAANADNPLEVYRFFRDEVKTHFIEFIPTVERTTPALLQIANLGSGDRHPERAHHVHEGHVVTARTVRPEQWGRFLNTIFDEWVRQDAGQVFIQMFDAALAAWLEPRHRLGVIHESHLFDMMESVRQNAFALNYLGAGYQSFFTHVDRPMRLMARRLRGAGYPHEVMRDARWRS